MNDSTKKVLLVVVVVVALVIAGLGARNYMHSEQGEVVRTVTLPPGQSMKKQEMERQRRERSGASSTATGGAGERDLSGSMGGR